MGHSLGKNNQDNCILLKNYEKPSRRSNREKALLVALNTKDGTPTWKHILEGDVKSLSLSNNKVVIYTEQQLYIVLT